MSASNGIKIEIPWVSIMRSLLLPHSGSCRLLPPTPVALTSILDSSTAADPAIIIGSYVYACMLVLLQTSTCKRMTSLDDVGSFALLPELMSSAVLTARRPQRH